MWMAAQIRILRKEFGAFKFRNKDEDFRWNADARPFIPVCCSYLADDNSTTALSMGSNGAIPTSLSAGQPQERVRGSALAGGWPGGPWRSLGMRHRWKNRTWSFSDRNGSDVVGDFAKDQFGIRAGIQNLELSFRQG